MDKEAEFNLTLRYFCTKFEGDVKGLEEWLNRHEGSNDFEVLTYEDFLNETSGFNIPDCHAVIFYEPGLQAFPILVGHWVYLSLECRDWSREFPAKFMIAQEEDCRLFKEVSV